MGKNVIPNAPYAFKHSARFQGKYLEEFIFKNSEVFFQLEERTRRAEGDALSKQIEFLVEASKTIESAIVCPYCREKGIKFLLFFDHRAFNINWSCCEDEECKKALLQAREDDRLVPLDLSGLRGIKRKTSRRKAELVFRKAFKLKKSASAERVFFLFHSSYKRNMKSLEKEKQNNEEEDFLPMRLRYQARPSDAIQLDLFNK